MKGYLNFLESTGEIWTKKWVTIRKPYLCLYDHEDDPIERAVINLGFMKVLYSEDQSALLQKPNLFSVYTRHRGYLFQASSEQQLQEWLHEMDPSYVITRQTPSRSQLQSSLSIKKKFLNTNKVF